MATAQPQARPAGSRPQVAAGHRLGRATRASQVLVAVLAVIVALGALAVAVGPRFLPYRTYTILTGSMRPTLPVGSEIVLRPVAASSLRVGDIISFHRPDRPEALVTHRIVRIERTRTGKDFVTRGDANGTADPWRVPATGTGWRYAFDIPYAGYVIEALRLLPVRIAILLAIALWVGAVALRRIWSAHAEVTP